MNARGTTELWRRRLRPIADDTKHPRHHLRHFGGNPLDADDRRELARILDGMRDLFRLALPS